MKNAQIKILTPSRYNHVGILLLVSELLCVTACSDTDTTSLDEEVTTQEDTLCAEYPEALTCPIQPARSEADLRGWDGLWFLESQSVSAWLCRRVGSG